MSASFHRKERLKSRQRIRALFEAGQSVHVYPLRLVWQAHDEQASPLQIAFSVPKRRYKKAVVRNRIKRLLREAYRLQKQDWYAKAAEQQSSFALMLIYTGKEELPLAQLQGKLRKLQQKWAQNL